MMLVFFFLPETISHAATAQDVNGHRIAAGDEGSTVSVMVNEAL
jgi:hypothetical protein